MISFAFPVDPSKPKPFAPKPIYPAQPSSLNSSASSTSSMSASSPTASPRTSLTTVVVLSADRMDASGDRNDLNNNGEEGGRRTDVPVRKIAGKKISALFEV